MARTVFLTIAAAFCFWYWFPAINILTFGFMGPDERVPSQTSLTAAAWLVLGYEVVAVAVLAAVRPLLSSFAPLQRDDRPTGSIDWLGYAALAAAIGFLTARFARDGIAVLIDLAVGLASARDNATFYNRSEDVGTSLMALWEIANIWLALFVIALLSWRRSLLSAAGAAALAALALLFVATGTRAGLMQVVFVIALTAALRGPAPAKVRQRHNWLYLLPLGAAAGLAFSAFASRFRDNAGSGGALTIVDTLLVNPDMTRETAFVLDRMPHFDNHAAIPFLEVPFSYALPRFLGFDRSMPEHLVAFNALRGDIDLVFGQGNIFPGIVADFHLVFGVAGAVMLAVFIAFHALVLDAVARIIPTSAHRRAFIVACIAYMFFSFRNIGGMLFLVMPLGVAVIAAAVFLSRRTPARLDALATD